MSETTTDHDPAVEDDDPLGNPYLGHLKQAGTLGALAGGLMVLVGALMTSEGSSGAGGPVVLAVGMTVLAWAGLALLVFWGCAAVLLQRGR